MDGRARLLAAGCIASGAVLALMILSPLLSPYGAFRGLDGSPGFIDGGWEGGGPAGLSYLLGDLVCHQEEARSLILNGSQMPVCARDTGILMGLTIGFAICLLIRDRLADRRLQVRRMSVAAIRLCRAQDAPPQLSLFCSDHDERRETSLLQATLGLHRRFGRNAVVRGHDLLEAATTIERNGQIGGHRK